MIKPIVLADLDDTLFQSRRKCPAGVYLSPIAFGQDGSPLGFATPVQQAFLQWLLRAALIVPVTGRSAAALRRVRLRYGPAICAHGGLILNEAGEPDLGWRARIERPARACAAQLAGVAQAIETEGARLGADLRVRVLCEGQLPLYVLAKQAAEDEAALEALASGLPSELPTGWTAHLNGNNLAILPPHVGKAGAVRHLLPRLRKTELRAPVIGIGDSASDAAFLRLCDLVMTPTGSQLGGQLLARAR